MTGLKVLGGCDETWAIGGRPRRLWAASVLVLIWAARTRETHPLRCGVQAARRPW